MGKSWSLREDEEDEEQQRADKVRGADRAEERKRGRRERAPEKNAVAKKKEPSSPAPWTYSAESPQARKSTQDGFLVIGETLSKKCHTNKQEKKYSFFVVVFA